MIFFRVIDVDCNKWDGFALSALSVKTHFGALLAQLLRLHFRVFLKSVLKDLIYWGLFTVRISGQ